MIGAILGPLLAALKKFIGGFIMLAIIVFVVAKYTHTGMSGTQAVNHLAENTVAASSAILGGVIDILKALWTTAVNHIQ